MHNQSLVRSLLASVAIAVSLALGGCNTDTPQTISGRSMQPLSDRMLTEIEQKNMGKESAILVRIFKQESELEVWKEDKSGKFALLKTYPICRWSGELGPKIKEGDRQAPEGFYIVTPAQINPNSSLFLSFNMGYPNAYDRAHGRTGAHLMVHGDCSSRGCYAMTDEQITEIYALARESFFGGQRAFQIQAYPFRMTPTNMAKHRNSPHMPFWKMLKEGYDHFELTKQEPKVNVCEKRYLFDAETSGKFSAADKCPAYKVPAQLMAAVREKQRREDIQVADLITRGVPAAPVKTGTDGSMHPIYLQAMKSHGGPGANIRTAVGTIPAHVNPPADPSVSLTSSIISPASAESRPVPGPDSPVQVASASPSSSGIASFFGRLLESKTESDSPPATREAQIPRRPATKPSQVVAPGAIRPTQPERREAKAVAHTSQTDRQTQEANIEAAKPERTTLLNGVLPTVPSGGFENRFGSWR